MNPYQQRKFDSLYRQHLNALRRQGKSPSTIDVYARAVRRIAEHFDRSPHALSFDELSQYFDWLIGHRSWSTVKGETLLRLLLLHVLQCHCAHHRFHQATSRHTASAWLTEHRSTGPGPPAGRNTPI